MDFFFFIWSEWCMRWLRVSPHPGSSDRGPPRDWGTCLLFASSVAPQPRSSPWNTACTLLGDAKVNWRWLRRKAFAAGDFKSEPSSEFYSLIVLHLTSETKTPKAKAADKVSVMRIPKSPMKAQRRQQPGKDTCQNLSPRPSNQLFERKTWMKLVVMCGGKVSSQ